MTDPKLTPREPSEAERLAQALTDWKSREVRDLDRLDAAAELRRLAALSESNAIDALNYESRIERLSDWELGFVDSLQRQLADGRRPTAKQIETLDTIWERATKRG